jgi:arsenate reductase (thioredoxin)
MDRIEGSVPTPLSTAAALVARLRALAGLSPPPAAPVAMPRRPLNVLVLCTGNSARSILGEALLTHLGRGRLKGFSAGTRPAGRVHPLALRVLAENGIPTRTFYSKGWDEFGGPGGRAMDIVITVCDAAAEETCPWWRGTPLRAHWGIPDPAAAQGTEAERLRAFREVFATLKARTEHLVELAGRQLDRRSFESELHQIAASGH